MAKGEINIETYTGMFEDAPLSKEEQFAINQNKVSEDTIINLRIELKRALSYKELIILEVLESNGLYIDEKDFKPFTS